MDSTAMCRCTTQWYKFGACMFGRSRCSPAKHDGEVQSQEEFGDHSANFHRTCQILLLKNCTFQCNLRIKPHAQNYRLVLTGHSLGAGVASLLAIVLKPKYPKLQCYAYSPPGCVIRYNTLCVLFTTNVFCFGSAQSVKARTCIALV